MIFLGILLPLAVWWVAAAVTDVVVALPAPPAVIAALARELIAPGFISSVIATSGRALGALAVATVLGVPAGVLAGRRGWFSRLLQPTVVTVRAVPFISIILIAVIWFSSGTVPMVVAVLMAFPIVVDAAWGATAGVDPGLIEMAQVFALPRWGRVRHLWLPGTAPGVLAGLRSAAGIAWKVTVAAEVLSVPAAGIGRRMGDARLYLETERVLAWTVVLILVAGVMDALLRRAERAVARRREGVRPGSFGALAVEKHPATVVRPLAEVELQDITVAWPGTVVFERFSLALEGSEVTAVVGPSGVGKTTLLRLLAGVAESGAGTVEIRWSAAPAAGDSHATAAALGSPSPPRRAMVFQEPRLLPWRSAAENVALAGPSQNTPAGGVGDALSAVGLRDVADHTPMAMSGGMQQRVALARALHRRPELLLVDEPLSGVDPVHRGELAADLVRAISRIGALTVVASHDLDLVTAVADRVIILGGSPAGVQADLRRGPDPWPAATVERIAAAIEAARREYGETTVVHSST